MYVYLAIFKPKVAAPTDRLMKAVEVRVHNATLVGRSLRRSSAGACRKACGRSRSALSLIIVFRIRTTIVRADDVILLVGSDPAAIGQALALVSGRVDRGGSNCVDHIRVFASRGGVVGMPLARLILPVVFLQLHPRATRRLDRCQTTTWCWSSATASVLCDRADFAAVRRFFGDSIKGVADFSYISLGVGAAMGLLVGLIPLPIPGVGRITLGLAGVLLVALGLGHIRRTGIVWTLPLSANMVLRNFGLTVFLAQVGIASGPQFAEGLW